MNFFQIGVSVFIGAFSKENENLQELIRENAELKSRILQLQKENEDLRSKTISIDISKIPLPSSNKKISMEEFSDEIKKVFDGWEGTVCERTVPTKEDVENLVKFLKPFLAPYKEGKSAALFALLLDTPWRETTLGLYKYRGDFEIAVYTTEGWFIITKNLDVAKITPLTFEGRKLFHLNVP